MNFVDVKQTGLAFRSCFKTQSSWYETELFFSVLTVSTFLFCLLPFGFVATVFLLPYIIVAEKMVLVCKAEKRKFFCRNFLFSARRYGRCFCILITRVVSVVLVVPYLSLAFSSFILSDCKELDYKGVLILSNELSKGNKAKMIWQMLFLSACFVLQEIIVFGLAKFVGIFTTVSPQVLFKILLSFALVGVVCIYLPLWRKYIENLYLDSKWQKLKEKQPF